VDELIQGLVAVLERGIVVEPYGENWPARPGAVRIRLANDPGTDSGAEEEQPAPVRRSW